MLGEKELLELRKLLLFTLGFVLIRMYVPLRFTFGILTAIYFDFNNLCIVISDVILFLRTSHVKHTF